MPDDLTEVRLPDDGLICPVVKSWAKQKYKIIGYYDSLFSAGMKNKWGKRVYIDLYAGAGYNKVEGTGEILMGSPLIALSMAFPFDCYIFCEENAVKLEALKQRVQRHAPKAYVTYVPGDCDTHVEEICAAIPRASAGNTALSLCLVDPFDFGMKHVTLERLSRSFMDFLVLLAVGMDATRNQDYYIEGDSTKLDEAFGSTDWRQRWGSPGVHKSRFRDFVAKEFAKSMESLGYRPQTLDQMKLVKVPGNNLSLYYLALFSKHPTADKFWKQVLTYSDEQTSFDWGLNDVFKHDD